MDSLRHNNHHKKILFRIFFIFLLIIISITSAGDLAATLLHNGGFEEISAGKPVGWNMLWTREPGSGEIILDKEEQYSGDYSLCIKHWGTKDWSFSYGNRIDVKKGDIFTIKAWVKIKGEGSCTICITTYDDNKNVLRWVFGEDTIKGPGDWHLLHSKFVIPKEVAHICPRLIGANPATIWVDDFSLVKEGNVLEKYKKDMPKECTISNDVISVTLNPANIRLTVTDKRTGQFWLQKSFHEVGILLEVKVKECIEMIWIDVSSAKEVKSVIQLNGMQPEFTYSFFAEGSMKNPLCFPYPFVSEADTYLIVPMNEGISYPVEDDTIKPRRLIAYAGHGICMPFWGVTNGKQGHMVIIETPVDASILIKRLNKKLCIAPEWEPQRGSFGYKRQLRYVFFDKGGHVAICKRYRAYAKKRGLLKTLEEKRKKNPNVDLLVGAVNVWCWEKDAPAIVREMKSLGMERILWSTRSSPQKIETMNEMGKVLTSRYDIYQDLMDPEIVKQHLAWLHPDWTQSGWPNDLMLDENGQWRKGWSVIGKDGQIYRCGILCDKQALKYARERVPNELKEYPYRCRFIDTTTSSPWRECYHPDHPMTRSESRYWKMELLRFMSEDMNLVIGSENGHETAIPYVHYFEGMLSLGPYRLPNAGINMGQIVEEVPQQLIKFQVGHKYRLPLWELVFHDCVVAHWYWGDYNNKLPALWDKRDLFNILYGTPPMFMFNKEVWENYKDRFVQSYKNVCSIARAVGYSEMSDHSFLTADRSVQQTVFSNGIKIIVNFGDEPYRLSDDKSINSMQFHIINE